MGHQLACRGDAVAHRQGRDAQREGQLLPSRLAHAGGRRWWGEGHLVGAGGCNQRSRGACCHPRGTRLPAGSHDHLARAWPPGRMSRTRPPRRGLTCMRLGTGTGSRRQLEGRRQLRAGRQPQQPANVVAHGDIPPVRTGPVGPLVEPPRPKQPLESLVQHGASVRGGAILTLPPARKGTGSLLPHAFNHTHRCTPARRRRRPPPSPWGSGGVVRTCVRSYQITGDPTSRHRHLWMPPGRFNPPVLHASSASA